MDDLATPPLWFFSQPCLLNARTRLGIIANKVTASHVEHLGQAAVARGPVVRRWATDYGRLLGVRVVRIRFSVERQHARPSRRSLTLLRHDHYGGNENDTGRRHHSDDGRWYS
jgi:hypothetical protein